MTEVLDTNIDYNFNNNKTNKTNSLLEDYKNILAKKCCFYCGSFNHLCRECPSEKRDSANYKLEIGKWAEKYVSHYSCPNCECHSLKFLGNHTPSLDIVCTSCGHMIEVKSKCLSINKLPEDIWMYHGNYNYYKKRVSQGLTFVIVIYAVNRITKQFHIRKVLYATNEQIKKSKAIKVVKNNEGKNSKIFIPNINILESWDILDKTSIEVHE